MAKVTATYETMLVFNTKLGEDGVKTLVEKFKSLIEANGTIDSIDDWGKRKLAYAIEDETEGYYVLYTFTCKPDFPAELERIVKITDGVLRSLVIAK
ncbi:MAG: 30S ribosomal protein S6 [Oscillospiraceae bacterium]|nr:30S ribosomal protein S6 [Oscillospiraceae bacterium]